MKRLLKTRDFSETETRSAEALGFVQSRMVNIYFVLRSSYMRSFVSSESDIFRNGITSIFIQLLLLLPTKQRTTTSQKAYAHLIHVRVSMRMRVSVRLHNNGNQFIELEVCICVVALAPTSFSCSYGNYYYLSLVLNAFYT